MLVARDPFGADDIAAIPMVRHTVVSVVGTNGNGWTTTSVINCPRGIADLHPAV